MGAYSFHYWSNEAGLGTIVLVHGFTGNGDSWHDVAGRIGSQRTIVSVDLPGHDGATPISEEESGFEGAVDRLAIALRNAKLQRSHLIGYSLGGRVCLGLMARHPDLVRSATLIGTHPGLRTDEDRERRSTFDQKWIDILKRDGIEKFVDQWEKIPLFSSQADVSANVLERQRATRLDQNAEALAASLCTMGLSAMPNYWSELRRLEIPVHLIVGAQDEKFCVLAKKMCTWLKDAKMTTVPGVGHNVVLEAPAVLAEAILSHCD